MMTVYEILVKNLTIINFLDQSLLLGSRRRYYMSCQLALGSVEIHHKCCRLANLHKNINHNSSLCCCRHATYTQTPTTVHSAVVGMPTYTQTPPTSPYFITNATGLPNVIILKVMILILNTLTSSNSQSTLFFNHCVIAKSL